MAWIRTVDPKDAAGAVKREYDAGIRRAGRVFGIVRLMSLHGGMLHRSLQLYLETMHGDGPLPRAIRETIAVVTSVANRCHY